MSISDISSKYRRAEFEEPSSGTETEEPDIKMNAKVKSSEPSNDVNVLLTASQSTSSSLSTSQPNTAKLQVATDVASTTNRAFLVRNLSSSSQPDIPLGEQHPVLALDHVFRSDDGADPIITASLQNSPVSQSAGAHGLLATDTMAEVQFHQHARFTEYFWPFWERSKRFIRQYPLALFLCLLVLFTTFVLVFLLMFTTSSIKPATHPDMSTCVSKACIIASADILRSIDASVDPCDDFYTFVCGQRLRTAQIPPGQSKWTSFSDLSYSLTNAVRDLLDRPAASNESLSLTHTRNFYQACLNETRTEELRAAPLFNLLDASFARPLNVSAAFVPLSNDSFGSFCRAHSSSSSQAFALPPHGWYLLNQKLTYFDTENANNSTVVPDFSWLCLFDWLALLHRLEDYNIEPFYDIDVSQDLKNSSRNMIQLDQPMLFLGSRDYYLNINGNITSFKNVDTDPLLHAYVDMIVMALFELRQELYNESGVCESSQNTEARISPLAPPSTGLMSIFEDIADDKLQLERRRLSATLASASSSSPASVTDPVSRVNTITKFATDIVRFEQRLALLSLSVENKRTTFLTYDVRTLANLSALTPLLDWQQLFVQLFASTQPFLKTSASANDEFDSTSADGADAGARVQCVWNASANVNVCNLGAYFARDSFRVHINSPRFLHDVNALLEEYLAEPSKRLTLHNYMYWSVVRNALPLLSSPYRAISRRLLRLLEGVSGRPPQWQRCVELMENLTPLGTVLSALVLRKRNSSSARVDALARVQTDLHEMVAAIKSEYRSAIVRSGWLSERARHNLLNKMEKLKEALLFPPFIGNWTYIDDFFQDPPLRFDSLQYFGNFENITRHLHIASLLDLFEPPDDDWEMTPIAVNAYYSPSNNLFAIPFGIADTPFYAQDVPLAMKFGGLGTVIGHELQHAFDDESVFFNGDGDLDADMLDVADKAAFVERTECIEAIYSNFSLSPGIPLNLKNTLGENLADQVGVAFAYRAYQTRISNHFIANPPLVGHNFTDSQLFFIQNALLWCSKTSPQTERLLALTDPHSQPKFRVLGTLQNMPAFANSFSCPIGSRMNPGRPRCSIWD